MYNISLFFQTVEGATEKVSGPVTANASGDIRVAILAKPGAKVSCVKGVEAEGVSVQIAARPVDGEANEELVLFISRVLELRKNEVTLDRVRSVRIRPSITTRLLCHYHYKLETTYRYLPTHHDGLVISPFRGR